MESRYTTASADTIYNPQPVPQLDPTYDMPVAPIPDAPIYDTSAPGDPTMVYSTIQPQPMPQVPLHSGDCGCGCGSKGSHRQPAGAMVDYGPGPFSEDLERAALANNNYREVIWTGPNSQLVLMSIDVGDDIGLEVHPDNDQILLIKQGQGQVQMGPSRDNLNYRRDVYDGCVVCVPKNTWHNIVNRGCKPIKLATIYSPWHHAPGVIDPTHEIADARED